MMRIFWFPFSRQYLLKGVCRSSIYFEWESQFDDDLEEKIVLSKLKLRFCQREKCISRNEFDSLNRN